MVSWHHILNKHLEESTRLIWVERIKTHSPTFFKSRFWEYNYIVLSVVLFFCKLKCRLCLWLIFNLPNTPLKFESQAHKSEKSRKKHTGEINLYLDPSERISRQLIGNDFPHSPFYFRILIFSLPYSPLTSHRL